MVDLKTSVSCLWFQNLMSYDAESLMQLNKVLSLSTQHEIIITDPSMPGWLVFHSKQYQEC